MSAAVSAQENWGGGEYIWESLFDPLIDPKFTPDPDKILISLFYNGHRLCYLDIDGLYQPEKIWHDSLSVEGYDDISGFMTYDGNRIYFASNRPGGYGGYDIWMSESVAGEWQLPINLGPELNTNLDETHPSLTGDEEHLYFLRSSFDPLNPVYEFILKGDNLNGQWTIADTLPDYINSDYIDQKPFISRDGGKLYFVSNRPNNLQGSLGVWVSWKIENIWSEPMLLLGDVNGYEIICGIVLVGHPYSAAVNHNSTLIIYSRTGLYDCFCAISEIHMAYRTTDISYSEPPQAEYLSLTVYPNPFNSSVNIQVGGYEDGSIAIYDILGRVIRDLGEINSGDNITWDGEDRFGEACPSGIYFVKYLSGSSKTVKNVTLIR
jgi:hypothetical protein